LKLGHQRLVSWTIRLASADVHEADALRTVDDKRGRTSDVERCQPETMIDAVALDHRAIWVDEDPYGETPDTSIIGHLLGALANDDQDLGPKPLIYR
jgi:hypothetical protein